MAQDLAYALPFGFSRAAIGFAEPSAAVTFTASGNLIGLVAHGFKAGDEIIFPTIVTTTGITINTKYYVLASGLVADAFKISTTPGGSSVTLTGDGTGTVLHRKEVRLRLANKITSNSDVKTVNYEGDNTIIKVTNLQSLGFAFDQDAFPIGAHAAIFGLSEVTSGLPDSYTSAYGMFGTSGELTGKTVDFWGEAAETYTDANGLQSSKTVRYWYPLGTLTASKPPELTTSDKPTAWQYTFNVTNMTPQVDVIGAPLPVLGAPLIVMSK